MLGFYFSYFANLLGRNNFCVKEVSSLPLSLCGKTQYYGDSFEGGECVYKKCDSECVAGKFTFEWDGQQYTRRRFCCNDQNMCNGTTSCPSFPIIFIRLICDYLISCDSQFPFVSSVWSAYVSSRGALFILNLRKYYYNNMSCKA